MPLPVSAWLSLPEAVRFVIQATGDGEDRVRAALIEAGLAGAITATGCLHLSAHPNPARYFAHPVLADRTPVPTPTWGTAISWPESRVGRYDLVRLDRLELDRWLAAASQDEGSPVEPAKISTGKEPRSDRRPSAAQLAGGLVTASYTDVKEVVGKRGPATEAELLEAVSKALEGKHVPREWVRRARDELFGKSGRTGRPKSPK